MVTALHDHADIVTIQPASVTERAVLIPLAGGDRPSLGTVCADFFQPHVTSDGLEPQIRELRDAGLYDAAMPARSAAMRLFPPSTSEPGIGSIRLYPLNPGEFEGLQDQNSESAQLGLAVAFLMARAQCEPRVIMATGAIKIIDAQTPVEIRPVHHVREKLRAFMAQHRSRGASALPAIILLPSLDPDGVPVKERYREQIAEIEAAGTSVYTVSTLSEVVDKLDLGLAWLSPTQRRKRFWSRVLNGVIGVTVVAALLTAGAAAYGRWQARPLPLEFSTTLDRRQALLRFPVQTANSAPDSSQDNLMGLCRGKPPGVIISHWLGLGARTAESQPAAAWALLAVSPGSLKLQHEGLKIEPSGTAAGAVQVVGEPETMLVGLLAWRQKNPDYASVETRLRNVLSTVPPGEWIARARNLVPQLVPGAVMTIVQTLPLGTACES